jgi:hypothetical protein
MHSPHDMRSPRRSRGRKVALWVGLSVGGVLPTVGCQVEYAGMTLPSGKYMHDDVQYFPPGPDFPWANTQAATQRARMAQMGLDITVPTPTIPVAAGVTPAGNINQAGVAAPNLNVELNPPGGGGAVPVPNPAPPANVPAPPPAGNPPAGDAMPDKP